MTRFTVPHQTSITTHYTTAENETIRPDLFPLEEVNYTLSKPNSFWKFFFFPQTIHESHLGWHRHVDHLTLTEQFRFFTWTPYFIYHNNTRQSFWAIITYLTMQISFHSESFLKGDKKNHSLELMVHQFRVSTSSFERKWLISMAFINWKDTISVGGRMQVQFFLRKK